MNAVKIAATLCMCCCLANPTAVSAQQQPAKTGRTLVIESSATVHARPDIARISFFVVTEAAIKGREENDKQVKKVKDQLAALGLSNLEVQIVPYAVSKVTVQEVVPNGVPQPQLEHVQTRFTVVVRDKNLDTLRAKITKVADVATENGGRPTGKIEEAVDALGRPAGGGFAKGVRAKAAGATPGLKIEWLKETTSDAQRAAVKRAVDEALANAQAAVGDAKLTVVDIHISHERAQRDDAYVPIALRPAVDPQASNSEVSVTMRVTVTYSY